MWKLKFKYQTICKAYRYTGILAAKAQVGEEKKEISIRLTTQVANQKKISISISSSLPFGILLRVLFIRADMSC
jgi:hypothetical protein